MGRHFLQQLINHSQQQHYSRIIWRALETTETQVTQIKLPSVGTEISSWLYKLSQCFLMKSRWKVIELEFLRFMTLSFKQQAKMGLWIECSFFTRRQEYIREQCLVHSLRRKTKKQEIRWDSEFCKPLTFPTICQLYQGEVKLSSETKGGQEDMASIVPERVTSEMGTQGSPSIQQTPFILAFSKVQDEYPVCPCCGQNPEGILVREAFRGCMLETPV